MTDETRESLFQKSVRRERGEYEDDLSMEETIIARARAIRLFYIALVGEGFSEQDALKIISKAPI